MKHVGVHADMRGVVDIPELYFIKNREVINYTSSCIHKYTQ